MRVRILEHIEHFLGMINILQCRKLLETRAFLLIRYGLGPCFIPQDVLTAI